MQSCFLERFDDIWEPSEKDNPEMTFENQEKDPVKIDITKEAVPPALLMKVKHEYKKQEFDQRCLDGSWGI